MIEQLLQRWQQLSARERRLLIGALAIAGCAIVFLLLIEPALNGREAAQARLPALRAQVAEADLMVAEARRLSSAAAAAPRASLQSVRVRLEQSIDAAGLRSGLQQIQATESLIDLRFRGIPFATWMNWLDSALRDTRLRVADLSVTRDAEPGMVTIRMVLELPGGERR
jgi:general secretion pathway protein M